MSPAVSGVTGKLRSHSKISSRKNRNVRPPGSRYEGICPSRAIRRTTWMFMPSSSATIAVSRTGGNSSV